MKVLDSGGIKPPFSQTQRRSSKMKRQTTVTLHKTVSIVAVKKALDSHSDAALERLGWNPNEMREALQLAEQGLPTAEQRMQAITNALNDE